MKFEDFNFDLESNGESTENVTLDINLIKSKIPGHSSKKLCEMIVCDRYFGFHREIGIMCMEELAKRRIAGDIFNFEDYIESSIKKLPPLNLDGGFDLRSILNQAIKK